MNSKSAPYYMVGESASLGDREERFGKRKLFESSAASRWLVEPARNSFLICQSAPQRPLFIARAYLWLSIQSYSGRKVCHCRREVPQARRYRAGFSPPYYYNKGIGPNLVLILYLILIILFMVWSFPCHTGS